MAHSVKQKNIVEVCKAAPPLGNLSDEELRSLIIEKWTFFQASLKKNNKEYIKGIHKASRKFSTEKYKI